MMKLAILAVLICAVAAHGGFHTSGVGYPLGGGAYDGGNNVGYAYANQHGPRYGYGLGYGNYGNGYGPYGRGYGGYGNGGYGYGRYGYEGYGYGGYGYGGHGYGGHGYGYY